MPHSSSWFVAALALRVQFPDPRGTSTDSNPGCSVPESSPLIAFAFDIGATGFTLEVVALEKLAPGDDGVFVIFAVTITGVDVLVVDVLVVDAVDAGRRDVVVFGTWVVAGDVEEGGSDEAPRTRGGDDAVKVKTSTSNKSGLDHIKRWALFSEKGERDIVFVG